MDSETWEGRPEDEGAWIAYLRQLRAEGKSPETVSGYRRALQYLSRALPDGTDLTTMTREHVAAWLAAGAAGGERAAPWSHSTLASYSRRARTYCLWACRQQYADANPMAGIAPVKEHIAEVDIPDDGAIRALVTMLARGRDFESRRDLAIICLLSEAGTPRATEIAQIPLSGLDLRNDRVQFWGKGGIERTIPFGAMTARVLTLYLRERSRHPAVAGAPEGKPFPLLFVGRKGPLTRHGVRQMLERRCGQAGVKVIPPHHFRHLTAHNFFLDGGQECDAMALYGWRSSVMAARYGAAARKTRAIGHARVMSIGDKILTGKK